VSLFAHYKTLLATVRASCGCATVQLTETTMQFYYNMHSCIICRPSLGPNLKGKLKFTCIIRTHAFTVTYIVSSGALNSTPTNQQPISRCNGAITSSRLYKYFIDYAMRLRQPSRLTPTTADERCAVANIFASARNTVRVHRRLQMIGIQSYHRRRRQLET